MISVIIPAYNEQKYLNQTIDNFYRMAKGEIEIIVILNGYEQDVPDYVKVIRFDENKGERVAMNAAAKIATGKYLMRIDAHCDIHPKGWDLLMCEAMKPRNIVVPVLTALDTNWKQLSGWYGFCNLLPTMEEKWANRKKFGTIEKNMTFTGCGFMISKAFYMEFGGADESLPPMGAIGPEFSLRAWLEGDGVFTRTDVLVGHIFGIGGYNMEEVTKARKMLQEKYSSRYQELLDKSGITVKEGTSVDNKKRTITIKREDEHIDKDEKGNIVQKRIEHFKYVYTDNGNGPSEAEIEKKFAPLAKKVGEDIYYPDQNGKLVKVA